MISKSSEFAPCYPHHHQQQQNDSTYWSSKTNPSYNNLDYVQESVHKKVINQELNPGHFYNNNGNKFKTDDIKSEGESLVFKIKPEMYSEERHLVIQVGIKSNNGGSGAFICQQCKKQFTDQRCLSRHSLIHKSYRPFRCTVCGKSFMLNGDLKRHLLIHSGDRPFACEACGRRFTLKGNLIQHFRTHVQEKQFTCTICRKSFAQRDSLHRHVRAHFGEKPYPCPVCGKKFSLKGDLGRHQLIHTGTKPHICPVCDRCFALKGNMTQHMRIHNKASVDKTSKTTMYLECKLPLPTPAAPALPQQQDDDPNNTIDCPMCKKTFKNERNLKLHVKRHELARANFGCVTCGKSFLSKSDHFFHTCVSNNTDSSHQKVADEEHQVTGCHGYMSPFYRHIYFNGENGSSNNNCGPLKENSADPTLMSLNSNIEK